MRYQTSDDFGDRLLEILLQIGALIDEGNRNHLLRGLPSELLKTIQRNSVWQTDLYNLITSLY